MSSKRSALKKPLAFSSKLILEWRPGSFDEFPFGLKEELEDMEKYDGRWNAFMVVFKKYHKSDTDMIDVDDIVKAMKIEAGYSAHDTLMFLKRLRRLNLVRFTIDSEGLIGKLDEITWLLN